MGVLVGRERELAELHERLERSRLVTVVGPGGVGKTALADAAAEAPAPRFEARVRRVDLTRIVESAGAPGALAAQLDHPSFDALVSALDERPSLLVVDNCEHVLDGAATAIGQLLQASAGPAIVATSRSPLELPGESLIALAPLPVPDDLDPDATCASVQLFLERARDAGADAGAFDLGTVAELCRRLDGLPLAIELAAARTRTLAVGDLAERLRSGVEVLERPRYRGQRRHRSIVDTIRWSVDLLEDEAAALLEQLAVFVGPFLATTAAAVAGDEADRPRFDALLDELVVASLVTVDATGSETRYRLLDTIRRFALERLAERGALDATYDRFVDVVLARCRAVTVASEKTWHHDVVSRLLGAFDDIAEALRWCNQHDPTPTRAELLCATLHGVLHQGRGDDVVVLARETLDRWPDGSGRRHAAAVATLATAEYVTGAPQRALALAEPALAALDEPGWPEVTLRRVIGQTRRALGDLDGSLSAFEEGARRARDLGLVSAALELEIAGALVGAQDGPLDHAITALDAAVAEGEATRSSIMAVWARTALGWLLLQVDVERAEPVILDALDRSRAIGYPIGVAGGLRSLAFARLLRDDIAGAADALRSLLDDLVGRGALSDARLLIDATAAVASRTGHPAGPTLAATASTLPFASLLTGRGDELVVLDDDGAAPVGRAEAFTLARRVLAEVPTGIAGPGADEGAPATGPTLALRGDVWEVGFDATTVSVRATKGMADLARLLADPGTEVHCLDLAGAAVEEASTGEVIDGEARRRYEARIRELQEELDDADAANDLARSERAQIELDALVDHLAAALGHAGRTRRAAGSAERARSAVTQRIRGQIRRLEELHPALGRHLAASITTGLWCAYRPERPTTWTVDAG